MKKFLIAATCLSLIVPAIASAQYNQNPGGKPQPGQGRPQRPGGGGGAAPARPGPGGGGGNFRPNPGGGGVRPNPGGGGGRPNPGNGGGFRPNPGGGRPNPGNGGGFRPNPGNGGGFRPGAGRPGYSGNWSGRRGAWGWNGRRVRLGGWAWPSGYGYQRWVVGGILPAIFLSQAYYYSDYAQLGFEAPPWGYQWVRYGPDLLLVNISTGQVADVEYGVFY
jgi:hypothetical protein